MFPSEDKSPFLLVLLTRQLSTNPQSQSLIRVCHGHYSLISRIFFALIHRKSLSFPPCITGLPLKATLLAEGATQKGPSERICVLNCVTQLPSQILDQCSLSSL